jgi:putative protein-disulfide isomerase
MSCRLYYVHDPMCSWCWAFRPVWEDIVAGLPTQVSIQRILGGLAPDNDQPMPAEMRAKIRGIWEQIQRSVPGTQFNFHFWDRCAPRRSTYPACRAVIAARRQGARYEESMILAIQRAYYLQARNPSDQITLEELAVEIGLEQGRFSEDLRDAATQEELLREIAFGRALGVTGFPSLILSRQGRTMPILHDYHNAATVLSQIESLL